MRRKRSKREKELLKLWERINIFYSLKSTQIENSSLTIFPVKNIQKWTTKSPLKELKIPNEIVDSNRSINGLNLYSYLNQDL